MVSKKMNSDSSDVVCVMLCVCGVSLLVRLVVVVGLPLEDIIYIVMGINSTTALITIVVGGYLTLS